MEWGIENDGVGDGEDRGVAWYLMWWGMEIDGMGHRE